METITFNRKLVIDKIIPPRQLFSILRKFGLKDGQIYGLMGRYEMDDLRAKLNEVEKIEFENRPALFLKLVKELRPKPRKPKQKRLFTQKRAKSEDLGGKMGD